MTGHASSALRFPKKVSAALWAALHITLLR
jgi:hypothetical protein